MDRSIPALRIDSPDRPKHNHRNDHQAHDDEAHHSPFCVPDFVHVHHTAIAVICLRHRYHLPNTSLPFQPPRASQIFYQGQIVVPYRDPRASSIDSTTPRDMHILRGKPKRLPPTRRGRFLRAKENIGLRQFGKQSALHCDTVVSPEKRIRPVAIQESSLAMPLLHVRTYRSSEFNVPVQSGGKPKESDKIQQNRHDQNNRPSPTTARRLLHPFTHHAYPHLPPVRETSS